MIPPTASVPCNGCTACCRGELVVLDLDIGEDPANYDTNRIVAGGEVAYALKMKPDGSCTYLGPVGCTIHGRAPMMCRTFDCRRFYLSRTKAQRKKMPDAKEIFQAAKARLHTLRGQTPSSTSPK